MSNRRRTRYTFVVNEDEYIDVLAYSFKGAFDLLEREGYYNIERIQKPTAPSRPAFRIDQAALNEAKSLLGLRLPVEVKLTGRVGPQQGSHRFMPRLGKFMRNRSLDTASGGMIHRITIKRYLAPADASRTLWHELAHAMQAERESADCTTMRERHEAWKVCSARGRGVAYMAKPIEVEAREHEALHDDLALTKPL